MHAYSRRYTGPVRAVVLDWAGTTVDHGSLAPVGVFVEIFRRYGVEVTLAQAREPMGVHKREHIRRMTAMPPVAAAWRSAHGREVTDADIDRMYEEATPIQIACLPDHSTPIPGVVDMIGRLRARGIKIGSGTGYNREMLDVVERVAATHGYAPDVAVAASEVSFGRPAPYLAWRIVERLGVWERAACVKVGDTTVDVEEGLNAGFWTVAVACTGNLVGLGADDWAALDSDAREALAGPARDVLARTGAHYVIDSAADLEGVVDDIEARLRRGERP